MIDLLICLFWGTKERRKITTVGSLMILPLYFVLLALPDTFTYISLTLGILLWASFFKHINSKY